MQSPPDGPLLISPSSSTQAEENRNVPAGTCATMADASWTSLVSCKRTKCSLTHVLMGGSNLSHCASVIILLTFHMHRPQKRANLCIPRCAPWSSASLVFLIAIILAKWTIPSIPKCGHTSKIRAAVVRLLGARPARYAHLCHDLILRRQDP